MTESNSRVRVLVVGGGASGATCALFLARAGILSTIFDLDRSTLRRAELNNFPGIERTPGYDWLLAVRDAAVGTSLVSIQMTRVAAAGRDEEGFFVDTSSARHRGEFMVLATGQGPFDYCGSFGLHTTPALQPYVKTNVVVDRWGETNVRGLFVCGVLAGWPSQTVVCAGSGANVAVRIASKVKGEFWVDHDSLPVTKKAPEE